MRLIAVLPLCFACAVEQGTCADTPAWTITDVWMELDNLTRVAVMGHAKPAQEDESPAAVVVAFDGLDLEAGSWTTVLASVALDPGGDQEFVVVSDDVRYWPGSEGFDDVCAVVYEPGLGAFYDLGCVGE